jgi:hypothetical protein
MKTSDSINEIAAALAKAQSEMKNAPTSRTNPHFKNKYAELHVVRDTVTPTLSKNGIAVVQGTEMRGTTLMVTTRLVHSSGQWFESEFPIAIDKPQNMGASYTYAKRYSLAAICNISADDDDDGETAQQAPQNHDRAPHIKEVPKPNLSVHEDVPRNVPATAHLTGDPKAAGNDAAKQLFKQLTDEMIRAQSQTALDDWLTLRTADINKLPSKWMIYIDGKYDEAKAALEAKAA